MFFVRNARVSCGFLTLQPNLYVFSLPLLPLREEALFGRGCPASCTRRIENWGEGPLCTEIGGRDRAEIHAELKTIVGAYLIQQLKED